MELLPVGEDAVLVEVEDTVAALSLAQWVRGNGPGCAEVVPAARTVLLDGLPADWTQADWTAPGRLARHLAGWTPDRAPAAGRTVEVPVVYDGPDLDDVAAHWGLSAEEAVRRHTGTEFVAAFCGFAPGFSYLAGLPDELAVPRLADPRHRVPPGSVAVADRWSAVYPSASPGGWRLIGRTDVRVWDLERDPPALLAPGTRVRFTRV